MTHIYLATQAVAAPTFDIYPWDEDPVNLLISYHYIDSWNAVMEAAPQPYRPARLMLDSGAYSAWKSGVTVDINALVKETQKSRYTESVALDVIGDWKGSLNNARLMRDAGSPAYPVFHIGEPWGLLEDYCAEFPKVGLSCRFGESRAESLRFYDQCFARAWPHPFHSFGWMDQKMLHLYPFHSADSSSWESGPLCWGQWLSYGGLQGKCRVPNEVAYRSLKAEIDPFLELQRKLKFRWRKQLAQFTEVP